MWTERHSPGGKVMTIAGDRINSFIPGFEEQLIGAKIGELVEVNVTFPEEYQAEELAGKPAVLNAR